MILYIFIINDNIEQSEAVRREFVAAGLEK